MIFLLRPLQKEKFSYSSTKAKSNLVEDIKNIFSEKGDNVSAHLSGKFISDNEFYVNSKNALVFSDSGSSGHNSLKGKITAQDNKVIIDLVVKPVPRIYVETFAPLLFGLAYLYYIIFYSNGVGLASLLYSVTLIILIPCVMLFLGQTSKDKLRKRFVNILKLTELNGLS